MAEVGALPPLRGVMPNFVDPHDQRELQIAIHSISLTLTTIFVAMRFYTRQFITRRLALDDCKSLLNLLLVPLLIVLGLCAPIYLSLIAYSMVVLKAQTYGFGRHLWDVPAISIEVLLKLLWASELIYMLLVVILKCAFLLFYARVFSPSLKAKWLTRFGMASCVIFYTTVLIRSIFLCNPIRKIWIPLEPGSCLNVTILPYASGFFNIISDFYILVLPMPFLWNLKMKMSRKLRIMAVFGVGSFACVASIIRLVITVQRIKSPDVTWNYAVVELWASIEIYVGIICACSLALPAFFDRHLPKGLGPYLFKLSSYFSLRSKAKSTRQTSSNKHGLSPRGGSAGSQRRLNGYAELDPSIEMSNTGEDLELRGVTSYNETTVRGGSRNGDVESLGPGQGVS